MPVPRVHARVWMDGEKHNVASMHLREDGRIARLTTVPVNFWGPYYILDDNPISGNGDLANPEFLEAHGFRLEIIVESAPSEDGGEEENHGK